MAYRNPKNTTLIVNHVFIDNCVAWIHISDRNRRCYIGVSPDFVGKYTDAFKEDEVPYARLQEELRLRGLDITKKPHIEDAFPATRFLWEEVTNSESSMCFIEKDNEDIWENLGLTQKEFEAQIDADVFSYGLEDIIVKYDDDSLYTCYGNLQSMFTEAIL